MKGTALLLRASTNAAEDITDKSQDPYVVELERQCGLRAHLHPVFHIKPVDIEVVNASMVELDSS